MGNQRTEQNSYPGKVEKTALNGTQRTKNTQAVKVKASDCKQNSFAHFAIKVVENIL